VAPGTSRIAWYDLEERIKELDAKRQRVMGETKLKDLAETIGKIYDRFQQETDPDLTKLMQPLNIHRFSDKINVCSDLAWLEPVRGDDKKRPVWQVARERIEELDASEKRVREQREKVERQRSQQKKVSSPPSPSRGKGNYEP